MTLEMSEYGHAWHRLPEQPPGRQSHGIPGEPLIEAVALYSELREQPNPALTI